MDFAEASAAIQRLAEIVKERPEVWREGNGDRHRKLTAEEKDLMRKLHDFYESLPGSTDWPSTQGDHPHR